MSTEPGDSAHLPAGESGHFPSGSGRPVSRPSLRPLLSISSRGHPADLDTYGRSHQSNLAATGIGAGATGGCDLGVGVRLGYGGRHRGAAGARKPGSVLVVPADGYYQVRAYASEYLVPLGVTVREARCDEMCDAAVDADMVFAETPANPGSTSSTCTGWR